MRCGAISAWGRSHCDLIFAAAPTPSTRAAAKEKFTPLALFGREWDHGRGNPALKELGVSDEARDIVDWVYFEKSRNELGPGFIKILSYFKEDGVKSIAQIEQAM